MTSRTVLVALLAQLGGCYAETDGLRVDVVARVDGLPEHPVWTAVSGRLGLGEARLLPCEDVARIWRIPTAHAHGVTFDTGQDVVVLDLMHGEVALPPIAPPPGRWCGVEVAVAPFQDDGTSWTLHVTGPQGGLVDLAGTGTGALVAPLHPALALRRGDGPVEVEVVLRGRDWLADAVADAPIEAASSAVQQRLLTSVEASWR